jgi:hypothetical protein
LPISIPITATAFGDLSLSSHALLSGYALEHAAERSAAEIAGRY